MHESQQWRGLPPDIDALEAACLQGDLSAIQQCAAWVDDPQPYTRARAAQAVAAAQPALWAPLLVRDPVSHNPTPGWWYVLELVATDTPAVWPAHATASPATTSLPSVTSLVQSLVAAAPARTDAQTLDWLACAHHALAVLPPTADPTTDALVAEIWRLGDDALVAECAAWQHAHQPTAPAPAGALQRLAKVRGPATMTALLARVRWGDVDAVPAAVQRAMQLDPLGFQLFETLEAAADPRIRAAATAALAPLVSRRFFVSPMTVRAAAAGVSLEVAGALEALLRYRDARRTAVRALARGEWVRVAPPASLPALLAKIEACAGQGWEDAMAALVHRQTPACDALLAMLTRRGSSEVREAIAEARDAVGR